MGETLTVRGAALKLGCSIRFIYELLWSGKLDGRKIGKQWRVSATAVQARLRAKERSDGTARR